jgi:hypothetical protein
MAPQPPLLAQSASSEFFLSFDSRSDSTRCFSRPKRTTHSQHRRCTWGGGVGSWDAGRTGDGGGCSCKRGGGATGRPGLSALAAGSTHYPSTLINEQDCDKTPCARRRLTSQCTCCSCCRRLMNRSGRGPFHANSTHSAPVEVEKDPALQAKQVAEAVAPAVTDKERVGLGGQSR